MTYPTLSMGLNEEIQMSIHDMPEKDDIQGISTMVDILNMMSPDMIRQVQEEDLEISKAMYCVKSGKKPSLTQIRK